MNIQFSLPTLEALSATIVDSTKNQLGETVGVYHTERQLMFLFDMVNLPYDSSKSRNVAFLQALVSANKNAYGIRSIVKLIEQSTAPNKYLNDLELHKRTVDYLNIFLASDGFQLRPLGRKWCLQELSGSNPVSDQLARVLDHLDFQSVQDEFERAIVQAESDPEDAITAACSIVESTCKCILDELELPYPNKEDIAGLCKAVQKQLSLNPGREDVEVDVKRILNGLISVTGGIGALRTHSGDAHGRGKRVKRVDTRIAKLAIHSAHTISIFFIETWQRNHSDKCN